LDKSWVGPLKFRVTTEFKLTHRFPFVSKVAILWAIHQHRDALVLNCETGPNLTCQGPRETVNPFLN